MFKMYEDTLLKKLSLSAICLSAVSGFYNIYMLKQRNLYFPDNHETFYDFISNILEYLNIHEIKYVFPVLIWLFPMLILTYFLSDYIGTDVREKGSIIFTRTNSRGKWFSKKCGSLIFYILSFYLIYILMLILIWSLMGTGFNGENTTSVIKLSVLNILFGIMTIVVMNVLSLFIKPTYSMIAVLLVYMVNTFFVSWAVEHNDNVLPIVKYTLTAQGMYLWHSDVALPGGIEFQNFMHLQGFGITGSVLAIIVIISIAYFMGFTKIREMDIL